VKRSALWTGWYRRRLSRDTFPGVAVLCYHGVRDDGVSGKEMPFGALHVRACELEAHCAVVSEMCQAISLDDWRAALAGRRELPPRPVLFTFDDGYRSVFTTARPILERHEIPAAIFVCTSPVAKRQTFWYDALALEAGEAAVESAKSTPEAAWDSLLARLSQPIADDSPYAPMRPEEVAAVSAHPLFEVGSHSATHPILAALSDQRQRREIENSIRELSTWTGRAIRSFAYPNGRPGIDFTPETMSLVAAAGIDFAFSTAPGFAVRDARNGQRLQTRRFFMLSGVSGAELAHRFAYSWRH
jgi:peptidoglycan/xylan/chitin deacetylase (PgdA/CDA1 family)